MRPSIADTNNASQPLLKISLPPTAPLPTACLPPAYRTGRDRQGQAGPHKIGGGSCDQRGEGELRKRVRKPLLTVVMAVLMVFVLFQSSDCSRADDQQVTIKIGGTGGAMGAMNELAGAFRKKNPGVNIVIVQSLGTNGGIKAVLDGGIDIGFSERSLNDDEHRQGLEGSEYARTPFMFVTRRRIAGVNFTLDSIAKIYGGEIRAWPDGSVVRLVLRPESDANTIFLRNMSPEMDMAVRKALSQEGMNVALTDQDSADAVEKIPGAIGTSTLSQMITEKRSFSPLPINGIAPDVKNTATGRYPYYKTLHMITRRKPAPIAKHFMEFVKSPEGREILIRTGNFFASGR